MRISIGFKIAFAAIVIGATLAAGAGAAGYFQYRALARRIDGEKLAAAGHAAQIAVRQRLERAAQLNGDIANDPSVVSYIAQAMNSTGADGQRVDTASIRDLIGVRARKAGFDFAAVLDSNGRFLTGSGDDVGSNTALARLAVIGDATKRFASASAIGYLNNRLYLLSAAPMLSGQQVQALLLTGIRFGNDDMSVLSARVGASFAVLLPDRTTSRIVATSLTPDRSAQLQQLADDPTTPWTGMQKAHSGDVIFATDVGGQQMRLRVLPLQSDALPVALLTLAPAGFDAALARSIAIPLAAFAAAAIALAWLALLAIWLRAARPLARLYALSEQSLRGDHALDYRVKAAPSIARIGECLNDLALRLDRYRVPPGTPHRRATDAALPAALRHAANNR